MRKFNFSLVVLVSLCIAPITSWAEPIFDQLTSCHKVNVDLLSQVETKSFAVREKLGRELFLSGEYQQSLDLLLKLDQEIEATTSYRGLVAAVAIAAGKLKVAEKYLREITIDDPKSNWVYLDLYKIGAVKREELMSQTCDITKDKVILLECAKKLKDNQKLYEQFLQKSYEASLKDVKDSYSKVYAAKALELQGHKYQALGVLKTVTLKEPSYVAALREQVRVHTDLGMISEGAKALNKLLEFDSQSPINHFVGMDHYKYSENPYQAMYSFNKAQQCVNPGSEDLRVRRGYILEVLGQPMSDTTAVYGSFSTFMSYFRPNELAQNRFHGFDYNLYYFRNNYLKLGANKNIGNGFALSSELGVNYKQGDQKETDYSLSAGLSYRKEISTAIIDNKFDVTYMPVQKHETDDIDRHSYSIKNNTGYHLKNHKMSFYLGLEAGSEQILATRDESDFKQISFMVNRRFKEYLLEVPIGISVKSLETDAIDFYQYRGFIGFNHSLNSKIYLQSFNELITVSESELLTLNQSLKLSYAIKRNTEFVFELSNEQELSENMFRLTSYGLSVVNNLQLERTKIKTHIELKSIKNFGVFNNKEMFVNFKIGVPF